MRTALSSLIALGIGIGIGSAAFPRANASPYTVLEPSEVTYSSPAQPGTRHVAWTDRVEVDLDEYMMGDCKWKPVTITVSADRTEGQISCEVSAVRIKLSALPPSFMWGELAVVWRD